MLMDVNARIYFHKLRVMDRLLIWKYPDLQLRSCFSAATVLDGNLVHNGIRKRDMASQLMEVRKDPSFLQKLLRHAGCQFLLVI